MQGEHQSRLCLVTGGAGFIGSHLVEGLLEQGYRVRVLDNLSTGSLDNLQHRMPDIEWMEGDIRDVETVNRACQGAYAVLHHAAIASVHFSMKDPVAAHSINVNGTLNLLEAARTSGIEKFIFASSAAVYGASPEQPKHEAMAVQPVSPYGLGKLIGEKYCEMYSRLYGLKTTCFRYFNVYGPRQSSDSHYSGVISIFANTMLAGNNPTIYGDGHQSRDFIHVHDIRQANLLALESDQEGFKVFNVANGKGRSILELYDWLKNHTGKDFKIQYKEDRRGDLRHSIASIEKIREGLSFSPKTSFEDGLASLVESLQAQEKLSSEGSRASSQTTQALPPTTGTAISAELPLSGPKIQASGGFMPLQA